MVWFISAGLFRGIDSGNWVSMSVAIMWSGVSSALLHMIKGSNGASIFSTSTPQSYSKTQDYSPNHRILLLLYRFPLCNVQSLEWVSIGDYFIMYKMLFFFLDTQGRDWRNEFDWQQSVSFPLLFTLTVYQSLRLKSTINYSHAIPLPITPKSSPKLNFITIIERTLLSYFCYTWIFPLLNTTDSKIPFVNGKKKLIIFKIISKTVCLMEKQFGYGQCYTMVKKCYHVHGCSESARARAGTLPHAEMKHSHNEGFGFIHMLPWFIQMLLCHVSKEIESHAMTLKTWPCFRIRTVGLKLLL